MSLASNVPKDKKEPFSCVDPNDFQKKKENVISCAIKKGCRHGNYTYVQATSSTTVWLEAVTAFLNVDPFPIVPRPSCISRWLFHHATRNKPVDVLTWLA